MYRILTLVVWLFVSLQVIAQDDSANNNIAKLSEQIAKVSKEQSKELAQEIASIREKLQKGEIQADEAEDMIRDASELSNRRLERRVNRIMREMEEEIAKLYEVSTEDLDKLEQPIDPEAPVSPKPPVPPARPNSDKDGDRTTDLFDEDVEDAIEDAMEDAADALEDAEDAMEDKERNKDWKEEFKRDWKGSLKNNKKPRNEARHTSQFIFAVGLNNLVTGNDLGTFDNEDIELRNSRFYEWGLTGKYRLMPNSAFLQFKYGVSLIYNNLRPSGNKIFQRIDPASGSPLSGQTVLVDYSEELRNEPYFRTTQLTLPLHLEFDFSKKKLKKEHLVVRSQKGIRLGVGGYGGVVTRVKQLYESRNSLGQTTSVETRGRWGTNNLVYGVSGYLGYKDFSFYAKYDLNPIFKENSIEQNNLSLGVRFDFN